MPNELKVGTRCLAVAAGDITRIPADVIVNAANQSLARGGGVDGAIHRAGGPEVMADLESRYGKNRFCETGSAAVSAAGNLPARWVVHAVGPRWRGGGFGEADLLWSAYRSSLHVADELGARTVTFPAISTGIYGYPVEPAATVAVEALIGGLKDASSVERVTLVLFSEAVRAQFEQALEQSRPSAGGGADQSDTDEDHRNAGDDVQPDLLGQGKGPDQDRDDRE